MSAQRLWYVLPLDIQADPNAPFFGPELENNQVQDRLAPARPEPRGGLVRINPEFNAVLGQAGADGAQLQAAGGPVVRGRGFKISAASKKEFNEAYTTEELAFERARERAAKEPKRPFGVFSCIGVVETMEAPIIQKEYNDAGELRVKA